MPHAAQRNTRQRAAIRRAFESTDRPLSPQDVLHLAQREVSGLGIATVYRNIKALIESGSLTAVALPNGLVLYEAAGKAHHHHFQCDRCKRVFEVDACLPAIHNLAGPHFTVSRHELTLFGLCAECQPAPQRRG